MNIYRQQMLDHYNNPRNFGVIEDADFDMELENLSCGDRIRITAKVNDDIIQEIKFDGEGCAVAIAAASILTEDLTGKPVKNLTQMRYEDLSNLLKIELSMTRIKCANLSLETAQKALSGQGN